jgi:hypothetical protein
MLKKKEDERFGARDLPLFYRLLLKIPIPGYFDWLSHRRFWVAAFVYALTLSGLAVFFMLPVWIMVYTYAFVGFPLNVVLGLSLPASVVVLWLRVQIERTYNFWQNLMKPSTPWNVDEVVKDYLDLFDNQQTTDDTE